MTPDTKDYEYSELELALMNREPKTFMFEVPDVRGHSGKPLGQIRICQPTVKQQDQATDEAYAYLEKERRSKGSMTDQTSVVNAKTTFLLHKVCKHATFNRPAFVSPEWMLEHMSPYELGRLLNNFNEVVRLTNPIDFDFDTDRLLAFAKLCSSNSNSEAPNIFLENLSAEYMGELAIRLGILLAEAKGI